MAFLVDVEEGDAGLLRAVVLVAGLRRSRAGPPLVWSPRLTLSNSWAPPFIHHDAVGTEQVFDGGLCRLRVLFGCCWATTFDAEILSR